LRHTHWRMHSFDHALSVTKLNTQEKERQMIGNTYDLQSKMSSKPKRKETRHLEDWKQQRRKQRRIKERERDKRYGNLSRGN